MNPLKISLLTIILVGSIFTALLVSNHNSRPVSPENDQSAAQISANLLAEQIDAKVVALQNSLNSLSYNTFWQSSPVAEWSYWLESQSNLFKAAGLSLVGVHAKSNDVLYFEKPLRSGQLGELKQPIERLYSQQKPVSLLKLFRDKPAIILLTPIKNIDQQPIGTLIGIKYLDVTELKGYHYLAKVPVALTKNGLIQTVSTESSPSLASYDLVEVSWPKSINSALWKLVLLVNPQPAVSGHYLFLAIGVVLTLVLAFVIYRQLSASSKNVQLLDDTLDAQLPIPEQINRLNTLQNLTQDAAFAELIRSIRARIDQLVQQKKSISIELRKSQESEKNLQATASSLTTERDSAVAAPRVKSEFLSRMGDEITTPMKSVVSMLKLLSEYEFESEPKQLLNIAKRSTRTLVDNLNNILDFSKLDAQMLKLKPSNFSVRELVDGLSAELSHYANEKGLSLQASCDPNIPPQVRADLSRIRQILRNLLGNAVRFTKDGEVSLFANMFTEDGDNYLKFAVKDTGVGIPAEAQKGLFDSLEQQTKLTNSSFAGRLRLIVSKYLAELMGGEIGVISEPGNGSQFWFTIKLEDK